MREIQGLKQYGTHVTDMKRGGALKHRHLVGKVTLQQVIYHAVEMKGPWPMTRRCKGQHGDGTFGDVFIGQ